MPVRYAIYYAPEEGSPLARFGAAWLGYDPAAAATPGRPSVAGLNPAEIAAATTEPHRYGFHATLKAPFRLAPGCDERALTMRLADFAASRPGFSASPAILATIGGFLALVPSMPSMDIQSLAEACVREFDPFRAPLTDAELARRRSAGLNPRQEAYLLRWGYPQVLEEFRFHMTLTNALPAAALERFRDALAPLVAPFADVPLAVSSISLFRQADGRSRFRLVERFPLRG